MQTRPYAALARFSIALLALGVWTGSAVGLEAQEPAACQETVAAPTQDASPAESEATPGVTFSPDRPRLAGGLRAHVDPMTGSLVAPPAGAPALELSPDLLQAFSTSGDGLVEVALPDGTVRVRLDGRFMSATVATIDADGQVRIGHGLPVAAPAPATEAVAEEECTDED